MSGGNNFIANLASLSVRQEKVEEEILKMGKRQIGLSRPHSEYNPII